MFHRRLTLVAVACSLALPAYAGVIVVDVAMGLGADYDDLQLALFHAVPGDTLLLRSGNYAPIEIDGFGITLIAETGANVVIGDLSAPHAVAPLNSSTIRNLAAGDRVVFQGIRFLALGAPVYSTAPAALGIKDCAGEVFIDSCFTTNGRAAFDIENSSHVAIVGGSFAQAYPSSQPVIRVSNSALSLSDSTVIAGDGLNAFFTGFGTTAPALSGGDGMLIQNGSSVTISHSNLQGGDGGSGLWLGVGACTAPMPGGNGIRMEDSAPPSKLRLLDTQLNGGFGGSSSGCGYLAANGSPFLQLGGVAVNFDPGPLLPPTIDASSPVREGQNCVITLGNGTIGATGLLIVGFAPNAVYAPAGLGSSFIAAPWTLIGLGSIAPPSLVLNVPIPNLPTSVEGTSIFVQIVGCASNGCVLGSATAIHVLDSSF